jgi:hypothetical protein
MKIANIERRIGQLEAALSPDGMAIVTVFSDGWPTEAEAAFIATRQTGDLEQKYQIIEEQTGDRPSRNPPATVIRFALYPGGPE